MSAASCVVVDTNVWAVAAGMHEGASDMCVAACLSLLAEVDGGLLMAVDQGDLILAEYLKTLRPLKNSGLAAKLAARLWQTRHNPQVCRAVAITVHHEPPGSFLEVPEQLRDFDKDDQKFLAVALAEGGTPPVFAALDREWWDRRTDLHAAGLDIQFLCAADLLALS